MEIGWDREGYYYVKEIENDKVDRRVLPARGEKANTQIYCISS